MANPKDTDLVRLSIDLPYRTMKRLDQKIPWGMKGVIFRAIAEHLCDLMEKEGGRKILFLVADGRLNVAEHLTNSKELIDGHS